MTKFAVADNILREDAITLSRVRDGQDYCWLFFVLMGSSEEKPGQNNMEEAALNHVRTMTRTVPAGAAQWHDIVCYGAQAIADFLAAFGESSPFLNYLTNKCDLPLDQDGD